MKQHLHRSFEKDGVSSFNSLVPELMANLMHNLPGMAYRCINDEDWTMLFISEGCYKLTGYTPQELLYNADVSYDGIILEEDRDLVREAVDKGVNGKTAFNMQYRLRHKDGSVVWVWERGTAVYDESNDTVYLDGFIADITLRKTHEDKLKQLTEELSFYNSLKDKFFNMVAHNLQNPVYAIISLAEFVVQNQDSLSHEQVIEFCNQLNGAARTVNEELINIMEWSRLHSGKAKIKLGKIHFRKLVEEILQDLRKQSIEKQINFNLSIKPELLIETDRKMFGLILKNLFSNAIKYSDHGQSVEVRAARIKGMCTIEIEDHGIGMPRSVLNRVFEVDQAGTNGTYSEQGKGIGLALCKAYANKLGIGLELNSKLKKGTKAIIKIHCQESREIIRDSSALASK